MTSVSSSVRALAITAMLNLTVDAFTGMKQQSAWLHSQLYETATAEVPVVSRSTSINLDHILQTFPNASIALSGDSPIVELPDFLSADECRYIQDWSMAAIQNGAPECDEYLNYRVNQEIETTGASIESQALLDDRYCDRAKLESTNSGGFRIRLDESIVENLLKDRIVQLLNKYQSPHSTQFLYEEGLWFRPMPRTVLVRDQTVVRYTPGDGVPPHVDGKDGTLLIYLNDVPPGFGGRTVFPDHDFAQTPVQGTALFYRSKEELVHYSEAMMMIHGSSSSATKWILQLLLDFDHQYKAGDCITDFRTGKSYVWDGVE